MVAARVLTGKSTGNVLGSSIDVDLSTSSRKSVGARVARVVAFIFAIFVFFGVVHLAVLGMVRTAPLS